MKKSFEKASNKSFSLADSADREALEPSLETVALWGVKMLPVVVAALTARNSGTKNVLETLIPQLKRKTAILRSFVAQNPVPDEK